MASRILAAEATAPNLKMTVGTVTTITGFILQFIE